MTGDGCRVAGDGWDAAETFGEWGRGGAPRRLAGGGAGRRDVWPVRWNLSRDVRQVKGMMRHVIKTMNASCLGSPIWAKTKMQN